MREVADLLHVDVMDGHFVPNLTIGPPVVKSLRAAHRPVPRLPPHGRQPRRAARRLRRRRRRPLHRARRARRPAPAVRRAAGRDVGVGLVLNPPTPVDTVLPYLDEIDLLLVMSVNPGWGGQAFIPEVLDKVAVGAQGDRRARPRGRDRDRRRHQRRHRAAPPRPPGCDILVAGSAVFHADDPGRRGARHPRRRRAGAAA